MRLFATPEWIHAQGAGPVSEMTLHLELYQAFAEGLDGLDSSYVHEYLRPRGLDDEEIETYIARRRRLAAGPASPDSLPVIVTAKGKFELDGDGHHRAVRHVFDNSARVSVEVVGVSPLWQKIADELQAIYPGRGNYLYQEIEHPYYAGWELSRAPARLDIVMEAVAKAGIRAPGQALEVGSCTGRFCRELSRAGWRTFGIDCNPTVVMVAEFLNQVFETSPNYWRCSIGDADYTKLLMGGDGWDLIVCLSVLHAYHTQGQHAWVGAVLRQFLDRTRCLVTDCDAPGRTFQGGTSWPEEQYRAWLTDICSDSHELQIIGAEENRTIYLLLHK